MERVKDLGVLWVKQGPKGEYMTGTIEVSGEKINIVCFLNTHKSELKHPDWRILKSVPRESVPQDNALPTRPEEDINLDNEPF